MKKLIVLLLFTPSFLFAEALSELEQAPDRSKTIKRLKVESLSDLQKLTPQESVSVIQRRYLPKTYRGEFNFSISSVINHTFFFLGGASARAGFFLKEKHGFGFEGMALMSPFFKPTAKDMVRPPNQIVPLSVVLTQLYGGAYYKWSPVFGKFAFLNRKIIYFDMYMVFGAGMNRVVDGIEIIDRQLRKTGTGKIEDKAGRPALSSKQFPAINLGVGQMFSITQDWAFNWDLKWMLTFVTYENGAPYTPWDINFSIGMNYYFPGASYR